MHLLFLWLGCTFLLLANPSQDNLSKRAIVKIYTTAKVPNYQEPWSSSMRSSTGSGAIIEGGYILTNAHVVANQAFIEVQRYGQRKTLCSLSLCSVSSSRFGTA
ncbi:MAG: trypsin-like serine protease [Sulfurovum sp.]|nr:trypsin-like serine protease [Sulfurovum sp.]